MSKNCKRAALLLLLTMLVSCVGVFAEEAPEQIIESVTSEPVQVEEVTEAPTEAPTETPAEEPAEEPTVEPTAAPVEEEKAAIKQGYALVEAGALLYAEPEDAEGNRLGAFTYASYIYVLECVDSEWVRAAIAFSEYDEILVLEGYVKTEFLTNADKESGAGHYLYNGVGLSTASFSNYGASPDAFVDPETNVANAERTEKYSVVNGQVIRNATGEAVSTETYAILTSGPALNYRAVSDNAVRGCLENGSTVSVIEKGAHWAFILVDGEVFTAMSAYIVDPSEIEAEEESVPSDAKLMSVIEDTLNRERSVSVYVYYEGESIRFGDSVALYAVLDGYDGTEYSIQWQKSADNENWEDISNATAKKYEVVVTEENYTDFYRVAVTLTGIEVDSDLY